MSQVHLDDSRNALERSNWLVVEELPGDDYRISATWIVQRPDGSDSFHIDFCGLDDMNTLPIEQAYACKVREKSEIGVYFARKGKSWPEELTKFIAGVNSWTR